MILPRWVAVFSFFRFFRGHFCCTPTFKTYPILTHPPTLMADAICFSPLDISRCPHTKRVGSGMATAKGKEGPKKHEYLSSDFLHHHSGQLSIWNRPRAETVLFFFFEGRWRPMSWRKQKTLLGKQPKLRPEQNKTMNVGRASSFSRQSSQWNRIGFPSQK